MALWWVPYGLQLLVILQWSHWSTGVNAGCPLHPHSEACVSIIQHVIRNQQPVNGSSSDAGCSELLHVHQTRIICNGDSFLQDGRIPEFRGFSGPTWAHEFVTLSRSVDGAIYLAFDLNVSVVLDHVFIGYLNCPSSRIGLPLVNVYWIDGNDYLNSPPLSGKLIGTIPSSTHTQGGAHECRTLEIMASVQHPLHAYSYVIVELLFSDDDDIVWTFLGEINFLIGRAAITPSPTTGVQLDTPVPSLNMGLPMDGNTVTERLTLTHTKEFPISTHTAPVSVEDSTTTHPLQCGHIVGLASVGTFMVTAFLAVLMNAVTFWLCRWKRMPVAKSRTDTTNPVREEEVETHTYEDVTALSPIPAGIRLSQNVAYITAM